MRDPKTGNDLDMEQALKNLNGRFEWLWKHDLAADVKKVEERTEELLQGLSQ